MPVKNVTIFYTDDAKSLAQNVEHELNRVVAEVNRNQHIFSAPVDANQQRIGNLANPGNAGDAVNLQTMQNAINTMSSDMFKILNRRTPDPYLNAPSGTVGGSTTYTIIFKAAEAQSGNAILGMSFPTSPAPTGTLISGTNVLWAAEVFQGTTFVQDRFPLPPNFTGLSSAVIYWATPTGTAAPTWQLLLNDVPPGSAIDVAYTSAGTVVATATTSLQLVVSTITNTSGVGAAGDLLFFKFGRSDTGTDQAGLLEIQFNISHS